MSEHDKLMSRQGHLNYGTGVHRMYDDVNDTSDESTDIDLNEGANNSQATRYHNFPPEQMEDIQKYRKRARRTHRRRVVAPLSRLAGKKEESQLMDIPFQRPRDIDDSSDEAGVDEFEGSSGQRVSAYCTCENYVLSKVYQTLTDIAHISSSNNSAVHRNHHIPHHGVLSKIVEEALGNCRISLTYYGSDVLHLKGKMTHNGEKKHIFVFEYGCVAFFNFTVSEEHGFITLLNCAEIDTLSQRERAVGIEDMWYIHGDKFHVQNDIITLASEHSLEKLSVAFAVSQCVKLNVFEERVDDQIEKNRDIPESLSEVGQIHQSREAIAKKVGLLFLERNNINLHADILDDPEFFWEEDKHKPVYEKLFKYQELGKRVGQLNKRLEIQKDMFEMVTDQMDHRHSERLEYVIITLIIVEVLVTIGWQIIVKDILGFFPRS